MIYKKRGSIFVWIIVLVIIIIVGIVAFYFYAVNKIPEDYKEIGEQLQEDNLQRVTGADDSDFGWNGGVRSFKSITCDDLIPTEKLNEILKKDWKYFSEYKEGDIVRITCSFKENENIRPYLYYEVNSKLKWQSFEEYLESAKSWSRSTETNDVGAYYFTRNIDSSSTFMVSKFLTDSEKYWVELSLEQANQPDEENHGEKLTLDRNSEIEINKVINDNLEKIN